jgi:hypothetical protein
MTYDRLRAWLETYSSDSYTENVVSALVDCAETLWHADGRLGEPLGSEAKSALELLESALHDEELVR